ncbi:hypothetical protein GGF32_005070 [Allomyces javanicus]|nr:hypothetical protein GGF32_005070 [Allomyces javanicus]
MSFIHFKFRSAKAHDSLVVDGMGMSAFDLKREIVRFKKLKGEDFDLILSNAETGEEYRDDLAIVPRNSSIVVRRIPVPDAKKNGIEAGTAKYKTDDLHMGVPTIPANDAPAGAGPPGRYGPRGTTELVPVHHGQSLFGNNGPAGIPGLGPGGRSAGGIPGLGGGGGGDDNGPDGGEMDEEDRINAIMQEGSSYWQATQEKMAGMRRIQRTGFGGPGGGGGGGGGGQGGPGGPHHNRMPGRAPPAGYVCYRCGIKGHFIQDCPTNGDTNYDRPKVKRTTGIPRSFLQEIDAGSGQGGFPADASTVMMNPEGKIVKFVSNEAAWNKIVAQTTTAAPSEEAVMDSVPVRKEFQCPLCDKILKEAVEISCCHTAFCDECIRSSLTSEGMLHLTCPECKSPAAPDNLTPNYALRQRITEYARDYLQRKHAESRQSRPTEVTSAVTIKAAPSSLESRITIRAPPGSGAGAVAAPRPSMPMPPGPPLPAGMGRPMMMPPTMGAGGFRPMAPPMGRPPMMPQGGGLQPPGPWGNRGPPLPNNAPRPPMYPGKRPFPDEEDGGPSKRRAP